MLRGRCPVCLSCLSVLPICHVGVLWPNGCVDRDATLYGGRPRPRQHCARWGLSYPAERDIVVAPTFRLVFIVAKRSPISATAELLYSILKNFSFNEVRCLISGSIPADVVLQLVICKKCLLYVLRKPKLLSTFVSFSFYVLTY